MYIHKPPQSLKNGGATRDRTADLVTASHALSQLSYSPTRKLYIPLWRDHLIGNDCLSTRAHISR